MNMSENEELKSEQYWEYACVREMLQAAEEEGLLVEVVHQFGIEMQSDKYCGENKICWATVHAVGEWCR